MRHAQVIILCGIFFLVIAFFAPSRAALWNVSVSDAAMLLGFLAIVIPLLVLAWFHFRAKRSFGSTIALVVPLVGFTMVMIRCPLQRLGLPNVDTNLMGILGMFCLGPLISPMMEVLSGGFELPSKSVDIRERY